MTLKQETALSAVNSWSILLGCRMVSFQDSRVCISVALLPKLVMLPGRDASLSEDDADRGAFLIFWSLFRCSQDATLTVCVCLSLSHCCDIRASCPSHGSLAWGCRMVCCHSKTEVTAALLLLYCCFTAASGRRWR